MPELVPGIDQASDKQGGEPCVAGTRVPVRRIGLLADRSGVDPADIAERYEVSLSDVHRALAYYFDHPDEMEQYDRRERTIERRGDATETFEEAQARLQHDA